MSSVGQQVSSLRKEVSANFQIKYVLKKSEKFKAGQIALCNSFVVDNMTQN